METGIDQYFDTLQRNGLSIATELVMSILVHMCSILEFIINDDTCLNKFLHNKKQKTLLCKLTIYSIENEDFYSEFLESCSNCETPHSLLLNKLCSIFANILLNNYCKQTNMARKKTRINDNSLLKSSKMRKLSTLK